MLRAGTLNQSITLTSTAVVRLPSGATREQPGNESVTTWAMVRQQGAAERQRNGITGQENTYAVRIRHRDDIDASWSINYRGRTLSITGVVEGGQNNREWLDITATEVK